MRYHRNLLAIAIICSPVHLNAEEWPQWRGPNRDGVWNTNGVVDRFDGDQLDLRWRAPVGSGYSGPTVADGRVYVTDRVVSPKQMERVHCFDWETGAPLWTHSYACPYENVSYEAGPRACVTIDGDRAYALGTMGHFHCLDTKSGKPIWSHDLNKQYGIRMPIWGIASAPIVVDDLVIVQIGGEGACLVAFDKISGEPRWRALDDQASYSAPILLQQAGREVLVCWTGDNLAGLDPQTGQVFWEVAHPPTNMVINVPTPAVSGDRIFLSAFYDGSTMVHFSKKQLKAEMLWHRQGASEKETDALHCMISTPVFIGDYVYGVDSYGELRCLAASSGDRVWEDLTATRRARWSNIHIVRQADRFWLFNEEGELLIARLSPKGLEEISRTQLLAPTEEQLRQRGGVCWAHPAFAYRHVFARNDRELVCASLVAK